MDVYAVVFNGVVINIIVLDDISLEPLFTQNGEQLVLLDTKQIPYPSPGWLFDGKDFSEPIAPFLADPVILPTAEIGVSYEANLNDYVKNPSSVSVKLGASNLPTWLIFEPKSGQFFGSPGKNDGGDFTDLVFSINDDGNVAGQITVK